MKKGVTVILLLFSSILFGQVNEQKHFKNIRQLTYGGDNAEAYFSFDGKNLLPTDLL